MSDAAAVAEHVIEADKAPLSIPEITPAELTSDSEISKINSINSIQNENSNETINKDINPVDNSLKQNENLNNQLIDTTTQVVDELKTSPQLSTLNTNSPLIIINHGPAPKRNVALKNTSAASVKTATRTTIKKTTTKQIYKLNDEEEDEEMINDSDKEGNIIDYNSNDEYMPPKVIRDTGSDGSDVEISVKRKSARLSKKPKMLEEYEVGESSNDSPFKRQEQLTQLQELDNNKLQTLKTTKIDDLQQAANQAANAPKQFARKSTAPGTVLTNTNQNFFINQQVPKRNTPIRYTAAPGVANNQNTNLNATVKQPVLTQIANGACLNQTNNNHSVKNDTISINSATSPTISTQTAAPVVKQYRNKVISCKPYYESKATECSPIVKDASTQIDLDEIRLNHTVVPVPVPIHVPTPMCMYQAPMPIPILIPIPIPVPIFIPTTKRTFDRVERKIQKLRKKLPSDPYEFDILLYAERLAREEGIAGFEESSDGDSEPEQMDTSRSKLKDLDNQHKQLNILLQNQDKQLQLQPAQNEQEGAFKWVYGVRIFNAWLLNKIEILKSKTHITQRLPDDLIKLKNDELNYLLAEFVHEIRKPTGEVYAPESVYYLCLGIQHYLQEKGRVENLFLDYHFFEKFHEALNEIALRYQIRINTEGHITSRIEEEILWESKQLGAYSPFVLLNTILYFNTKYFFLDKPESHLQLSFTNVKKHSKRNIGPNNEDYGKTVFLRYYPDFHGLEQVIYEQGENYDNPLRCPVELYNFYLSKCPENVKNRSDVFYLLPEKASVPSSPVWFSSQPLSGKMLERMLNRVKMVREVNELLIAASPTTSAAMTHHQQ